MMDYLLGHPQGLCEYLGEHIDYLIDLPGLPGRQRGPFFYLFLQLSSPFMTSFIPVEIGFHTQVGIVGGIKIRGFTPCFQKINMLLFISSARHP